MKSYAELKKELEYEKYKNRVLEEIVIKYESFLVAHNKEIINVVNQSLKTMKEYKA